MYGWMYVCMQVGVCVCVWGVCAFVRMSVCVCVTVRIYESIHIYVQS